MCPWPRWLIVAATLAAAGPCAAQPAPDAYPSRPVHKIVPFGAGGPGDVFARLVAQRLGENLRRNFLVESHPGAGGTIGTAVAARAAPDGYTLVVKQRMLAIGFEPMVTTPEEFAERIRTDIPRLGRIVREAHIKPE